MSWEDVKLSDLKEESKDLPAGNYVLQVAPGSASYRNNKFSGKQELNVRFTVTEGDYKGRAYFHAYSDPSDLDAEKASKMLQGLKKLQVVFGIDPVAGEDTAKYFNRVAAEGAPKFSVTLKENRYLPKGEKDVEENYVIGKPRFQAFSVKPAV